MYLCIYFLLFPCNFAFWPVAWRLLVCRWFSWRSRCEFWKVHLKVEAKDNCCRMRFWSSWFEGLFMNLNSSPAVLSWQLLSIPLWPTSWANSKEFVTWTRKSIFSSGQMTPKPKPRKLLSSTAHTENKRGNCSPLTYLVAFIQPEWQQTKQHNAGDDVNGRGGSGGSGGVAGQSYKQWDYIAGTRPRNL